MTEEKNTTWGEAFGPVFKIHPIALLLSMALVTYFGYVITGELPFTEKLLVLGIGAAFIFVIVCFEASRIAKDQKLREKSWRRRVLGR